MFAGVTFRSIMLEFSSIVLMTLPSLRNRACFRSYPLTRTFVSLANYSCDISVRSSVFCLTCMTISRSITRMKDARKAGILEHQHEYFYKPKMMENGEIFLGCLVALAAAVVCNILFTEFLMISITRTRLRCTSVSLRTCCH